MKLTATSVADFLTYFVQKVLFIYPPVSELCYIGSHAN